MSLSVEYIRAMVEHGTVESILEDDDYAAANLVALMKTVEGRALLDELGNQQRKDDA